MARPKNTDPTYTVRRLPKDGPATHFAWTVYFEKNGIPDRKQGKVSVSRHAREHRIGGNQKKKESEAERAAGDAARAFIQDLATLGHGKKIYTLQSWCLYFCEHVLTKDASPEYATTVYNNLEFHAFPMLGAIRLRDLTAEQVEAWFEWRRTTPSAAPIKNGKGEVIGHKEPIILGWKTLDLIRGYLKRCLDAAFERRHTTINVMANVAYDSKAAKKYRKDLKARKHWFKDDEIIAIQKLPMTDTIRAIVLIDLDLGVRAGEACGLPLNAVDLETGAVAITQQLRRAPEVFRGRTALEVRDPKGEGVRLAFASRELLDFVKHRLAEEAARPVRDRCPYVVAQDGRRVDPNRASKMFRLFCEVNGIKLPKGTSLHSLRRTILDAAKMAPVSRETKAQFGGHDDYSTSEIYHHLNEQQIGELRLIQQTLRTKFRKDSAEMTDSDE
jgi:integrase